VNRIIYLALTLALLPLACGEEEPPPPPPPIYTPVRVLKNVELSFDQRNVDLLKASLSPDFVYYTKPGEMGDSGPDGTPLRPPPSYSFTEFWHIAYNMFNGAYAIDLSIPTGGIGEPGPEETTFSAHNVEVCLLVLVGEKSGYVADEGYCHFEFEKYKDNEGRDRWRLTTWWDETEGGPEGPPGIEHVPLWYILSLYEQPT
jgi:hypothetical protein